MKIRFKLALLAAPFFAFGSAQAAPKLTPTTPAKFKQTLAKSKGKPTLVNFWATWCSGCVAELPALAKVQKANAGKANVILVAANELAPNAKVQQTLQKAGHKSSLIFRSDLTQFLGKIAPGVEPVLPITLIYDKHGKLVKKVSGEHTQAELQKMLTPYFK